MRRGKKPGFVREAANKQISHFLDLSLQAPARAKRYISLAQALSKKYNTLIPSFLKQRFCKHCNTPRTSKSLVVRTTGKPTYRVRYICKACGKEATYGYAKEKRKKRSKSLKS